MRGGYRRGKAHKPVINLISSIYLMRDQFLTDKTAGTLNDTVAEPIPGIRGVTDVENKLFILDDRLRGGGQDTPVWGQSKMAWQDAHYGGFARVIGRTLVGLLLPEDTIVSADIAFGFASALTITDPRTDGLGFLTEDGGELDVIVPGVKVKLRGDDQWNLRPMQYLIGITLNDVGAYWWISTFGTATSAIKMTASAIPQYPLASIIWVDRSDISAALFPYVQYYGKIMGPATGYPNGNSLEDVRLMDVSAWAVADVLAVFSDRFTRADSALTPGNSWTVSANSVWGISSSQLYFVSRSAVAQHSCVHESGLAAGNGIFTWDWTAPPAGAPCFFLYWRFVDVNNWFRITNGAGGSNTFRIQRNLAGVQNEYLLTAYTWTPGTTYHFTAYVDDDRLVAAVNNVILYNVETAVLGQLTTATKMGVGEWAAPIAGERWDNIAAYPLQTTLPSVFSYGKIPTILTGGAVLAQDSFTGINGTLLTAHTPDAGPAWQLPFTNWAIQGNRADPVLDLALATFAVQDLGVTDAECSVTCYVVAGATQCFPGIVGRFVDVNHFIGARLCWASYAPTAHEVEMNYTDGGAGDVYHKINLGTYYTAGSTHTLKMQFKGDLIQVFLDGEPVISFYVPAGAPNGTKFGLQSDYNGVLRDQEGHTFDSWIVRTL